MGDVFPEIRTKQKHIEEVLRREEEAFNKTLDKGIDLFEREVARENARSGNGSATAPVAVSSAPLETSKAIAEGALSSLGARYWKRRLPHFERPWAKYMVTFSTRERRQLTPADRDVVLASILYAHDHRQYELYAASVMPDHAHLLFEPQIKSEDAEGKPVFWSAMEIVQAIKSVTAHRINKATETSGSVWENESFDRLIRSDADLEEKFNYITRNPWDAGIAEPDEDYPWVWFPEKTAASPVGLEVSGGAPETAGGAPALPNARATRGEISAEFAFRLYDEQGFPLDLTALMARERGLTVDTAGFEKLMEEQRARARAAQKKQVIELSQIETKEPTIFLGYDHNHTGADVQEIVALKDKTAVVLNNSVCYAEMGGQVGDTGELTGHGGRIWRITNTQKSGDTWLHFLGSAGAPPAVSRASR